MNLQKQFHKLYKDTQNLSDTGREYDTKISNFVSQYGNFKNHDFFMSLNTVIQDTNTKKSFLALCVLHTYLRRNKKYQDMKMLEDQYVHRFESNPAFQILHLRLEINIPSMPPESQLEYAKQLSDQFYDNDGVTHDFCMLIANNYEQGKESLKQEIAAHYIEDAKNIIDKVAEKKYSKFLWTKARIYAILSELEAEEEKRNRYYEIALKSIQEAWMLEKPGEQYNTRMMTYRNYEVFIKSNYMLESAKREINTISMQQKNMLEETKKEFESLRSENLEIIGFFVAVISFTIGLLSLAQTGTFIEKVCTIIVLMSALLIVYGGLGIILHGKQNGLRNGTIIVLGILLIAAAILLELYLSQNA